MQDTKYLDIVHSTRTVHFERVKTTQKVLLVRESRDGVSRGYLGAILALRKNGAYIIDLEVDSFFENGILLLNKKKTVVSFRNAKVIRIHLIQDVSNEYKKQIADFRKAYSKSRFFLKEARVDEDVNFTLLGASKDMTLEDFFKLRKKLMLRYHPDRVHASGLSQENFERESRKFLDAMSYVENFLTSKYNRLK